MAWRGLCLQMLLQQRAPTVSGVGSRSVMQNIHTTTANARPTLGSTRRERDPSLLSAFST